MTATYNPGPALSYPPARQYVGNPVHTVVAPPQPVYVQAPKSGSSNLAMALLVVLCAVAAAVGGWFLARESAPSNEEMIRYQALASQQGFRTGQMNGISEGRSFAIASQRRIAELKAGIARENARNKGYRRGMRDGLRSYRQPASYGYGGGYRGSGYYGPSRNQRAISSALGSAQAMANATGAPVDLEIY